MHKRCDTLNVRQYGVSTLISPETNRLDDDGVRCRGENVRERQSGLTSPICSTGGSSPRNHIYLGKKKTPTAETQNHVNREGNKAGSMKGEALNLGGEGLNSLKQET